MISELAITPFAQNHVVPCANIAQYAPDPWSASDLSGELTRENALGFVAQNKTSVVGFALFHIEDTCAELALIAVHPTFQRQGVAKQLLQTALLHIQQSGCERCLLEVRSSNISAVGLYRSMGFSVIAQRRALYSAPLEDGFTMQKQF